MLPLDALDLGHLALFVGNRVNELVLAELHAAGFEGARISHGYVFQHVVEGPRTITELARRLAVSQQAASKMVAELSALGFLEDVPSNDARSRQIALSAYGKSAVRKARSVRAALEKKLVRKHGKEIEDARLLLARVLDDLGGTEAIGRRQARAPR
jgi:DNA-binding MarR family transcriptional regulator